MKTHMPKIITTNDQIEIDLLDVKFSQREKCVIILNLNSEPQAS